MMKQSYTFLIIILFTLFLQPMSVAAVTDWARKKAQEARAAVAEKIQQAQHVTDQLQQALKKNANCLVNGTCTGGEKERMVLLAKTVGITVAALIAIAATAMIAVKVAGGSDEEIPLEIKARGESGGVQGVSIESLASKVGITIPTDESVRSLFIRSVQHGIPDRVREFVNSVMDRVKLVGKRLAQQQKALFAKDIQLQKNYTEIETIINNSPRHPEDDFFVQVAVSGLDKEVQERMCAAAASGKHPTQDAQQEALRQLDQAKAIIPQNEAQYEKIKTIIQAPQCTGR